MDNMLDILKDMAKAALKMSTAITYAEEHPGDPHGADDVDYSRDFVVNTIRRFQAIDPLVITLTVHSRDQLNSQATNDGIDPLETIARIEALIATWHKSPDLRTRAHADRLSEALDGRPRA